MSIWARRAVKVSSNGVAYAAARVAPLASATTKVFLDSLPRSVCCIYHKPRAFDESSSSGSSSGSDSDSDSASDADSSPPSDAEGISSSPDGPSMSSGMRDKITAKKRDTKGKAKSRKRATDHHHDHEEVEGCEHHGHGDTGGAKAKKNSSARKAKTGRRSGRTMVVTETEQGQGIGGTGNPGPDKGGQGDEYDAARLARNAYERGPT